MNLPSLCSLLLLLVFAVSVTADECTNCHGSADIALGEQHSHRQLSCISCHAGNPDTADQVAAHNNMVASPGNLSNAEKTCGQCHGPQTRGVMQSTMHTGEGVVRTTRKVLEPHTHYQAHNFQSLGNGIADSMMRKLCASCHLGHEKPDGEPDAVFDRGGGCLACHIRIFPGQQHPGLTRQVEDGRCFGCHSRSGRIALNYAGLAETTTLPDTGFEHMFARLPDGRLLRRLIPDIHHQAGMACIDCHTGDGLMGMATDTGANRVDINCDDCHANRNPRLTLAQWPKQYLSMTRRIPFSTDSSRQFLQTRSGTPLIHIDTAGDQMLLHPKLGGAPLVIPSARHDDVPSFDKHSRLSCNSCHTRWVPACLGCHMEYDPQARQWDHTVLQLTPGAWYERRWNVDAGDAILGKRDALTIDTFLPGMIMTLDHPSLDETKFIRRFAPIASHTTGTSRSCNDCHRSTTTLGLGKGEIEQTENGLVFYPEGKLLGDGLPEDAWASLDNSQPDRKYPRPFNRDEIKQIFLAPVGEEQ